MKELTLPENLKKQITGFTAKLQEIYSSGLVSVILYGSAASNEFVDKRSNLNVLVVLNNPDLENLKKASGLAKRLPVIRSLFLTENFINSSIDVFPIEFLDMQENYFVLYGKDILKDIHIDTANLRFQCEHEIKGKILHLRQLYLKLCDNKRLLRDLLFKSATSVAHILRNVLRLRTKQRPPYQKQPILKAAGENLGINTTYLERILSAKNKQIKLTDKDVEVVFAGFVQELEKISDIVDKL